MQRQTTHFSGRVQGVGFRYTTQQIARDHVVAGYVRNLPDGRVELVAEGEAAALDGLLAAIRGRMRDNIDSVQTEQGPATGEFGAPRAGALEIRR